MSKDNNLERDPTIIDTNDLVNEWRVQSRLRREAGEEHAAIAEELRDKKDYYKFRKNQIAFEYRSGKRKPLDEEGKLIKLTDKTVESLVESDADLFHLSMEISVLQRKVDNAFSFIEAVNTKKYGLQEVGSLWRSDYWSDPRIPEEGKNEYYQSYQEAEEKYNRTEERDKLKERRKNRNKEKQEDE